MTKPQRGPVGMAAEALKETLVARLQPGVKDSVINDGLFRAIKHIDAFLHVHKETQAELDELKAVVRSIVLKAAHGPSAAAAGGQDGTQERPRSESSVLQSRPRALHTSASLRSRSSGQSSSAATADIDWTMPQSLVNSKAFVRQRHSYGRMMMAQDELTRRAEEERAAGRRRAMEQTRAMYDQQMEAVDERRRAEKQELRDEQTAMDEALRQYQRDEEQRRRQQQEAQAATRQVFREQVEEVIERRQEERREEERERYLDKLAAEEVAREERERQARVARENKERRAQMKAELAAALRLKAELLAKEQEEERELNIANMKAMDAKEQARLAVLKARADWQRMLYERGGGAALQASLEEQARLDAERAARAQAEFERKQEEAQRRKLEQRKREVEEMVASVKEQLAWKEAQHMQAVEDKRAARAAAMAQWTADQQQRKADLAAKRQIQREAFAHEQQALMQDRRRRFKEHTDPINPKELWVHKHVEGGGGLYRNFVNLAVPQHFTVRGSLQADSAVGASAIFKGAAQQPHSSTLVSAA